MKCKRLLNLTLVALMFVYSGCGINTKSEPVNTNEQAGFDNATTANPDETVLEDGVKGFKIDDQPIVERMDRYEYTTPTKHGEPAEVYLHYVYNYKYDADGNKTEEYIHINDELYSKSKFSYDEHDKPTVEEFEGGGLPAGIKTFEYDYDDNDRLTKKAWTIEYVDGSKVPYNETYSYDEEGRLVRSESIFGPAYSSSTSITEYKYDEFGNIIKEIYIPNGSVKVTTYEYDFSNEKAVKVYAVENPKNITPKHYKYMYYLDDYGRLIKKECYETLNENHPIGNWYLDYVNEYTYAKH